MISALPERFEKCRKCLDQRTCGKTQLCKGCARQTTSLRCNQNENNLSDTCMLNIQNQVSLCSINLPKQSLTGCHSWCNVCSASVGLSSEQVSGIVSRTQLRCLRRHRSRLCLFSPWTPPGLHGTRSGSNRVCCGFRDITSPQTSSTTTGSRHCRNSFSSLSSFASSADGFFL